MKREKEDCSLPKGRRSLTKIVEKPFPQKGKKKGFRKGNEEKALVRN